MEVAEAVEDGVTEDQSEAEEDTDEAAHVAAVAKDVAHAALLLIVQCLEAAVGHTHHPGGSALVPAPVPTELDSNLESGIDLCTV